MSMGYDSDYHEGYNDGQKFKQQEVDKIKEGLKTLLKSYKAQSNLPVSDEFNRGWVSAFSCVYGDLENILKQLEDNGI